MAIRMNPVEMEDSALKYSNNAAAVEEVIKQMDALLAQLREGWEGEASKSYSERYEQLKPKFVEAKQLIDDIAGSLRASARAMQETDNNIAQAYRA